MKKKLKTTALALLVIFGASIVWVLIEYAGIRLGGLPSAVFTLVVLFLFSKVTGINMGFPSNSDETPEP